MQLFSRTLLPLLALLLTTIVGPAAAQPVLLEAIAPSQDGGIPTQAASGWSLTFRATAGGNPPIGVAAFPYVGDFPIHGKTGFLVYDDPGGCFSDEPAEGPVGDVSDCLASTGAIYVEFTPDVDTPDCADRAGNDRVRRALTDDLYCLPPVWKLDVTGISFLAPFGAFTGAAYGLDGYGYGADDDLPGLVILSDTGIGVALDDELNRHSPPRAHNLAGLNTSVGYELNDGDGRTAILASLLVPQDLFTPLVLVNNCLGESRQVNGVLKRCSKEGSLRQIDGGPLLPGSPLETELTKTITVRAFLVSGTAPSTLEDLDHDLTVGVDDARIAGYQVLSNEVVVRFEQLPCSEFCPSAFAFDLDRNGNPGQIVGRAYLGAKAGPKLTKPPD